ncbi:uncharacterized protein LOC124663241 [Lolium rigidum]|uniref:uncharacterized protein LOC124663241 n=1 Tax=Lolium rigidum TaxID=89674 RepID=UPI001F5C0B09|nr:uncharacterized protein LOC124663241 [Lolium rigidum]
MEFAKEVVLPAALSELLARLFSFALDNFPRLGGRGSGDAHRRRLERLLASIGGAVEEAEGRHITNDHVLSHLKALTAGMYRARFALEATDIDVGDDDVVERRRSLALSSPFNSAKRLRVASLVFGRVNHGEKLAVAIEDLESLTRDCMREEGGHPDQTIWASDGGEYLAGVRRILGKDERFASRRSLLIFEDAWPIDPSAWSAFAASPAAATMLGAGSKLLLTSRDSDNACLGTADPVVLRPLPQEEYWYYFKAFAFGGMDAGDHPRMAAMGKEMARQLGGTFLGARMVGTLLRSKFDVRFWRRLMEAMVKCSGRRPCPVHVNFLLELLSSLGKLQSYGSSACPPRLTLRDALCNHAARTTSDSGHLGSGGRFTIHLCRETLYMDHWYTITLGEE